MFARLIWILPTFIVSSSAEVRICPLRETRLARARSDAGSQFGTREGLGQEARVKLIDESHEYYRLRDVHELALALGAKTTEQRQRHLRAAALYGDLASELPLQQAQDLLTCSRERDTQSF